jgi:hypothetical protein
MTTELESYISAKITVYHYNDILHEREEIKEFTITAEDMEKLTAKAHEISMFFKQDWDWF